MTSAAASTASPSRWKPCSPSDPTRPSETCAGSQGRRSPPLPEPYMKARRTFIRSAVALAATAPLAACSKSPASVSDTAASDASAETIKVGVLHSLSGTMAISETTLKDTVLMLIEAQNKAGGVLGRKLEAVVVDPASDWPLFATKAEQLLVQRKVAVAVGCWTSVSRKSVLPVFEQNNGLLFYPVQYEGEESSKNVFYTGAAPNQQAIPGVDYLMNEVGVKRWVLEGTDYV